MTVERGVRLMAGVVVLSCSLRINLLALADGLRRTEPVAIGIYQLVSRDGHFSRHGHERCGLLRKEVRTT